MICTVELRTRNSTDNFPFPNSYHQKYLLQKHPFILNALDIEPGSQLNGSFVAARLNGYVGGYGTVQSFEKELPQLELEDRIADYVRRAITHGKRVDC